MGTIGQGGWRPSQQRKGARVVPAVLLACVLGSGSAHARCDLEPGPSKSVTRVIDGETIALDDGTEVRLIGALAPRALDTGAEPGTWAPETAAIDALKVLVLSRTVTLGYGGERMDRYGRHLAHVFVGEGDNEIWVQGHMLRNGHGRAYAMAKNRACQTELLAHERVARDAKSGVWREAAYAVRNAAPPWALLAYRGTFQIVDGEVTRAADGREGSYINFGSARADDGSQGQRRAFAATINRSDRDTLGDLGGSVAGLKGQRLEVRGWIESKSGPVVDVSMAGMIASADGTSERPSRRRARKKQPD
jgi:micrococcal nuclease